MDHVDDQMLMTQEAIMKSMKDGLVVLTSGLNSVKEKAVQAVPISSDNVKENLEYSK